jgi:dTDP-4-dehydrorhamnose reductase
MSQAPARVWVLGGTGMVGHAVMALLRACGHEAHATGQAVDITDAGEVLGYAQRLQPTHIINCAAMTAVDACEGEEPRACAVNGAGPGHVAQAAVAVGAAALHISSDYVFAGDVAAPRRETDETGPRSAYGRSKLQGERAFLAAAAAATRPIPHYVVRTAWVFGPDGKNFVRTMLQLMRERERVAVVADQHGRPTYTLDLARALGALMGLAPGGLAPLGQGAEAALAQPAPSGVYHFANGGSTTWHGLCEGTAAAARAVGLALQCREIAAVTTAEFVRPAPRPAYGVLDTHKIEAALGGAPRPWQAAVADYLRVLA